MTAQRDSSAPDDRARIDRILAGYQARSGAFDEMMDAEGRVRGHWQPFLRMLAEFGGEEMTRRFASADRHLRDSGVFYRVYEDPAGVERSWPLSHVPLLIAGGEWRQLQQGLIQRAQLLEAVIADIYGPARLVRDGLLPAALVAGSPEFLRPLVGTSDGRHLRFYAADLARAADGGWRVIGDRALAPSGAGFALENRLALAQALPDIYRALQVERLAPFFQSLQAGLAGLSRRDNSRVCLLTPGPLNDGYFEHAYLARYLGFLLVQGEDLTVRDDGVFVRTIAGLQPADVILSRVDADFVDPLELNARSRLGVPGLVQAARDGAVTVVNALGSGVVESRALLGYLPALARAVLGQELALPAIDTHWLGDPRARMHAIEQLDAVAIASAFGGELAGFANRQQITGSQLNAKERALLAAAIARRGIDYVMQEPISYSTMPAWQGSRFEPRPFTLRVYLVNAGGAWSVMPGGFVRLSDDHDSSAISLQRGGRTADAWVLSDGPVANVSLLPSPEDVPIRRTPGMLPSRAAENLMWVGRYVERIEATLRLVRALVHRVADNDGDANSVVRSIRGLLAAWGAVPADIPFSNAILVAGAAWHHSELPGCLPTLAASAHAAAGVIRDRFSPDTWRTIVNLVDILNAPQDTAWTESVLLDRVNQALRIIASFSGLVQENMSQLAAWRFLEIGRRIERAIAASRFAREFALADGSARALDTLLELFDSQITYRTQYVMVAARAPVVDLVVLDPSNPRSIAFQLDRIEAHIAALPRAVHDGRLSAAERMATGLTASLRTAEVGAVDSIMLLASEQLLMALADTIAATYFTMRDRAATGWEMRG